MVFAMPDKTNVQGEIVLTHRSTESVESFSAKGYIAPGPILGRIDGTVWPMTALAAYPWASKELDADLRKWRASPVWAKAAGKYGVSPFNLDTGWVGADLIGIDLGSFCLGVANHRAQTVWKLWRRHQVSSNAIQRIGFHMRPRRADESPAR